MSALPEPPSRQALAALAPYLRPHGPSLALAAVCVAVGSGSAMAMVPLARYAADAFGHLTVGALNVIVLGLVALFALRGAFTFAQAAISSHVALAATARLREDVFARLLALDLAFHRRHRPADLGARLVQDVGLVKDALAALLAELVPSVIIIMYALGYVFWLNWRLALATLVGAPIVGLAIAHFGRRLHDLAGEGQARVSDVFVRAQESLAAAAIVKAFGREAEEAARFTAASQAHRQALWRAAIVGASQSPVIATLQTAAMGGVLWVGGWEIIQGRLKPADLIAFAAAIGVAVDPTLAVSHAWSRIQIALAGARRVVALLAVPLPAPPPADAPALGPVAGALAAEDVSFAYEPGRPALLAASIQAAPGETVALVGPSGAGKSTLAMVLVRLGDPDAGRVTLDGRDLRTIRTGELRRAIAYVPQDPVLFAGTIGDNLRFGRPDATDADLEAACRVAQAHDFIAALPAGYATSLGEAGGGLSGGQRQRLAIARALVADPTVLVLDEATSALDNATEEALRLALAARMRGRTVVIVAHRLAAIAGADRVYVLADGQVVQAGTPAALLGEEGPYRRLAEAGEPGHA